MKRRLRFAATTPVVPEPQNGSRMTSPSSVLEAIIRSRSRSGFCVGCFAEAFLARAGCGDRPHAPHLEAAVLRLHRPIIERVPRL